MQSAAEWREALSLRFVGLRLSWIQRLATAQKWIAQDSRSECCRCWTGQLTPNCAKRNVSKVLLCYRKALSGCMVVDVTTLREEGRGQFETTPTQDLFCSDSARVKRRMICSESSNCETQLLNLQLCQRPVDVRAQKSRTVLCCRQKTKNQKSKKKSKKNQEEYIQFLFCFVFCCILFSGTR